MHIHISRDAHTFTDSRVHAEAEAVRCKVQTSSKQDCPLSPQSIHPTTH